MSLRVWLPFTGDLHNQGLSEITVTNTGATVDNNGKIGKCYSFNGSSQKIQAVIPSVSSSIGSLACWVKFNSLPSSSAWYCLMQIGTTGGFANCRLGMYVEHGAGINISINGSSTGANYKAYSFSTGVWYHICTTYDGINVKLYINGIEQLNKTASIGSYTTNVTNLFIGGTNNYYFNGYMNDVRIYDHCLSQKEVKEIAKGLILHYPLNMQQLNLFPFFNMTHGQYLTSSAGIGTNDLWNLSDFYPLREGCTYIIKKVGSNDTATAYTWTYDISKNKYRSFPSHTQDIIFTATENDKFLRLSVREDVISQTSVMEYLNEVEDCSGYSRNGSIVGTLQYFSSSIRNDSCTFTDSGISNYIQSPTLNLPGDQITMNIWFKTSSKSPTGGYHMLVNSGSAGYYEMSMHSSGYIRCGLYVNGSRKVDNGTSTKMTDGNWHMGTLTFDGTTIKRYVDGVMEKSTSTTGTLNTSQYFVIGRYGTSASYGTINGYYSDLRIYTTALTEEDILELYHTGQSIDKKGNLYTYEYEEED